MVWTSDYPEGRPGSGSKPGSVSGSKNDGSSGSGNSPYDAVNGKSGSSSSGATGASGASAASTGSKSATAVAAKPSAPSGDKNEPDSGFKPNVNPISGGSSKRKPPGKPPGKPGAFLLLAGVFLPFAAIAFELSTHMCAKSFFDPFPTPAHVLLFALIPVSNLLVWVASRRNMTDLLGMLTLGTGMSMGVAILYSLMFLPMVPLSVVAILFFGFGLLALSPLLAIPAVWKASKYAIHLSESQKTYFDGHQLEHIGHLIILCTVVAVELPSTMTRMHIGEAAHSAKPAAAIDWLRHWGNQEVMLRACYERSGRATDILGSLYEVKNPTSVDDARAIFYKVTGKPFNSVPLPAALRATRQNQGLLSDNENEEPNVEDEFDRDPDIAGEAVSGVARGLSMDQSKLTGHIDGNSCIANLMWSVTFGNTSQYDREVRSKIILPPGAVVTNAFLIVDGTEREATVMGRSLARKKYRAAVADKKDPLLVSTCGADRVLLQLYPVAPMSKIGVRLHVIAPLAVTQMDKAELALPTFEERNFQVEIPTTISLKSQEHLVSSAKELRVETLGATNIAQGSITTPELARFGAVVVADRNPSISNIQGTHDGYLIGEDISPINYPRPSTLFVVLDGSNGMSPHIDAVLKKLQDLKGFQREMAVKIKYVRDELLPIQQASAGDGKAFDDALSSIAKISCAGGQDNLSALRAAISQSTNTPGSAVLWIHSAQPLPGTLGKTYELAIRKSTKPLLYDFAVAAGPNEILSGLYNCPGLVRVNRGSYVENDLHQLFDTWQKANTATEVGGIRYILKQLPITELQASSLKLAEPALAKLVAFDEVSKIQTVHANHRCKFARKAVNISNAYHLVTSFSSAIITEPIPRKVALYQTIEPPRFQLFNLQPTMGNMRPSRMLSIPPVMMAQQESRGEVTTIKQEAAEVQGKNLRFGHLGASNAAPQPSSPGSQFASASEEAASPSFREHSLAKAKVNAGDFSDFRQTQRRRDSERDDFGGAKEMFAEKKQLSAKDDISADKEFNDDDASADGAIDDVAQSAPGESGSAAASPVVPESDTYVLFGVGMLILGFALQTRKKVRTQKA